MPPPSLDGITLQAKPAPITDDERRARIEKARRLMAENGIDAMFLEGGTSMFYFTGVRWGNSERTFGVVIPAKGELAWVTPGFEEERARELIKFSNDVRVWQEDESPYKVIAGILNDRGVATGKIGIEERVRFFIYDGVRQELPQRAVRERDAGDRRLPHDQVAGRDRADAARERHHARRRSARRSRR